MFSLYKVTRAAFDATSKWIELQLRGAGDEGDDAACEPVDKSPFMQSIGFAVRPVVARTLRSLGYQHGNEVLTLKVWDRAKNPTDLESGETRAFSAATVGNMIRLLTNRVVVEAPEIRLGAAATKRVNREGDTVSVGTMVFAFNPVGPTLSITYTPPGGSPQVLGTGSGTITLSGLTGAGSSKVLAED